MTERELKIQIALGVLNLYYIEIHWFTTPVPSVLHGYTSVYVCASDKTRAKMLLNSIIRDTEDNRIQPPNIAMMKWSFGDWFKIVEFNNRKQKDIQVIY